jgi:hypothetical protein
MFNIGDRVKVTRLRGFKNHLVDDLKDYPIEVIELSPSGYPYRIEIQGCLNIRGNNVTRWISGDDLVLDREYYRNLKIEKLLE